MPKSLGKIPATLTILTKNSGQTLEKALESAKDFEDIVICDGGSSDNTLDIAQRFGANVISQNPAFLEDGKIFDYAGVRNQTYDAAKYNWIFWLDSDEYASDVLIKRIQNIIEERGADGQGAFWVNRKYVIDGTIIDCAATYPNRQMRFFAKSSTEHFVKRVHERIKLRPGVQPEFIKEVMYLPFEPDIEAIRRKWDYQIAVAAAQAAPLTLVKFLFGLFDTVKVSLLWFSRLAYNSLFCSGTKMPFKFEMERHRFHLKLMEALWDEVHIGGKRMKDVFPVPRLTKIIRFLISGGTAAVLNLAILYICTDFLHVWYVYSTLIAFLCGLVVSFSMQKFWAFRHENMERLHVQFLLYTALQLLNLAIDTAGIYFLVQYAGLWYIFAQILLLAIIAIWTFFVFNRVLFRPKHH